MSNIEENYDQLYNPKFYLNPTESVSQTNKIIRNVKKKNEEEIKGVRTKAEFYNPDCTQELYDALVFKETLYPKIKEEIDNFKSFKKNINKTNIYRAETEPNFSPYKTSSFKRDNKTSQGLNVKHGLTYILNEYYHPGSYDHFVIGDSKVSVLAWSCCINTDEKAKVS